MHLTALITILILLAAILLIPLGVRVKYSEAGFAAWASISAYRLKLYPPKPKECDEPETEAGSLSNNKSKNDFLASLSVNDWLTLARAALRALQRFKNGIRFDLIQICCVVSARDPYDAVMRYNAINGFVGSAIPFFESDFKVRHKDIIIDLDLEHVNSRLQFEISAFVRVGRLLAIAFAVGFSFLKLLIKKRIRRIRERKARNGEQQT